MADEQRSSAGRRERRGKAGEGEGEGEGPGRQGDRRAAVQAGMQAGRGVTGRGGEQMQKSVGRVQRMAQVRCPACRSMMQDANMMKRT